MKAISQLAVKKIISLIKLLSIELLIVLIAFITSFITIVFFIKLIFLDKHDHFDMRVFELIKPSISDNMTSVMNFFTFFGGQYFLLPANLLLIIYAFFYKKDKWFAITILSVALSSLVLMFSLKYIFRRPRPLIPLLNEVPGLSFPSGHAFMSFAFFGILIYMIYKKVENPTIKYPLMFVCFLMTTIIGFSRIYLRVHYASDVFVGFSLSLIWLVISLAILNKIEKSRGKIPVIEKKIVEHDLN